MASYDTEALRTALVGRPEGKRQRFFRTAKTKAVDVYIKIMPTSTAPPYWKNVSKSIVAEFVGTFLFVFLSAGAYVASVKTTGSSHTTSSLMLLGALVHGLALTASAAIAGPTSGGYVNPALAVAAVVTGRLDAVAALSYIVGELAGAWVGGFLVLFSFGDKYGLAAHVFGAGVTDFTGFEVEVFLTFLLAFSFWQVSFDPKGNSTLGALYVGLSLFVAVLVGGPLTGASLNPARTFGTAFWSGQWDNFYIYCWGPIVGAAVAGLIYEYTFIRTTSDEELHEEFEEVVVEAPAEEPVPAIE
eukprot:TRINITY_DN2081_c0_g1_i4.p1 TRINITY_DN2081_c0_g1~~TRINITY_DN2081_c0_g1_i4.p1  ORF type:complete len:301 (-),score=58.36 TRINITY_DN2081_c0_g1_i4:498-1400(-)